MSPKKIISQDLIDWASDDELVGKERDDVSFVQEPIVSDVETLHRPQVTNEPKNQMEVVQKLLVTYGDNGVCPVSYTHLTLPTR